MIFCSLYSGSSGNSILIGSENSKILIDAGLPGKKIDEALASLNIKGQELDGIFITHEHSDHIKGVGIVSRKYDVPIFANADTWAAMEKSIGKIKEHNIRVIDRRSVTIVKDLEVKNFCVPHDAAAPSGYTVALGNKRASVATDFGIYTQEIRDNIKDSQVLLLESNHDINMVKFGPYPYQLKRRILSEVGHLCNEDCGKMIVDILKDRDPKKIILGHLSNTNNHPDLAYESVSSVIRENGIKIGEDIHLSMANRHNVSELIML